MSNAEIIELELESGELARFYDTEAACRYMGVSYQTMNRRRDKGWVLPAGKVGISFLYTQARLDECKTLLNLDRKDDHVEITRV